MVRKNLQSQQESLAHPPDILIDSYRIAKVDTINGNNIYTVTLPISTHTLESVMVELPPKFRNNMWIRRNGFVVVNLAAFGDRVNKLSGEIVAVIHDEKKWRKMPYWPSQFEAVVKTKDESKGSDDDDELEGNFNRRRYDSEDE